MDGKLLLVLVVAVIVLGAVFVYPLLRPVPSQEQFEVWAAKLPTPSLDVSISSAEPSGAKQTLVVTSTGEILLTVDGQEQKQAKSGKTTLQATISDGDHLVEVVASLNHKVPSQFAGLGNPSPYKTTQVWSRTVFVDTSAPAVSALDAHVGEQTNVIHLTGVVADPSGVKQVLAGNQTATMKDGEWSASVPLKSISDGGINVVTIDERGNKGSTRVAVSLPPNRWEKWVWGKLTTIKQQEPIASAWGYGLGVMWRQYASGVYVETLDSPWYWYLLLGFLGCCSVVCSGLAVAGYQQAKAKAEEARIQEIRRAQQRESDYQRAEKFVKEKRWDEAHEILRAIPPDYKESSSLLEQADYGSELDGLCAEAEAHAQKREWEEAEAAIARVPDTWVGLFTAAMLKETITEGLQRSKEEAAERLREEALKNEQTLQKAKELLAHYRWGEAIAMLKQLPQGFRAGDVNSLLDDARQGKHFDSCCAKAETLVKEGNWLEAEKALSSVPSDWRGQFDATALKKQTADGAAKQRADQAIKALGENPWDILGVAKTASGDEVRRAFRALAWKWHPDRNKSAIAEPVFKAVTEAYECMTDPDKMAEWERKQAGYEVQKRTTAARAARRKKI